MATIKEVADLAGVSVGTVSHVITGSVPVSEVLRQRVEGAIKDLDYHPNHVARSLKTSRTRTLGIIVPDMTISFYPQIIRGAETGARDRSHPSIRHSRPEYGAYKMGKASLLAMAQNLAAELGPRGIRVNSVAPGYIYAGSLKWYFDHLARERGLTHQDIYDEIAADTDLRRLPVADEVADAVVFLASDMARAITGQCLDVNAGEFHH